MLQQELTEYLTVEEAAVRAHVSSPTIRRALKAGALRYRATRGKTKLLAMSEVDAWSRERTEVRQMIAEEEE